VNGASVSCRFAGNGSLSTAMFISEGSQRNAAQQLPGLTAANALKYLSDCGYVRQYDEKSLAIGKSVNKVLAEHNLLVETVRPCRKGVVMSVIDLRAACFVCPVRLFVGLWDSDKDHFEPLQVNQKDALSTFFQAVSLK